MVRAQKCFRGVPTKKIGRKVAIFHKKHNQGWYTGLR